MNIVKHELKTNLKSFIIWALSLSVIFLTASIEFEAYHNNQEIVDAMESFQPFFQALGVSVEDMTTPKGYLVLVSVYIYLPLSIYAGMLGSGIISKEEKNKTAEFLFTMPTSRGIVLGAKLFVSLVYTFLLALVSVGVNVLFYLRFGLSDDFYQFALYLFIGVFLTELIFLGIGMFLSSVLKRYKISGGVTIGLLISTFLISMLIGFVSEAEFLRFITPFEYFSAELMASETFKLPYIVITFFLVACSFIGLFYFYKRRDLTL